MIQKRLAILIALAVVAGSVVYFATQERGLIGEMRVQALAGTVTLVRDGEAQPVTGEATIEPGDTIRTSSEGLAKLRLTDDRLGWLATGTRIVVGETDSLQVESGRFLAQAKDAMEVEFDGVSALASEATFRIDQDTGSSRAAAYSGTVELAAPGQPRTDLPTLFEAPISAGRLPMTIRPLRIRDGDWDLASLPRDELPALSYLEEILELDQTLTRRGDGLETQLGNERPRLSYFRQLAGRRVGFMRPLLKRPVKDLLIGFTIAKNSDGSGSLKKGVRRTFNLRDDGGRWGIVAAIQQTKPKVLLSELGGLIIAATGVGGGGGFQEATFTFAAGDGPSEDPGEVPPPGGGPKDPKDPKEPPEPPTECEDGDTECFIGEVSKNLPNPNPDPTPTDPPLLDLP